MDSVIPEYVNEVINKAKTFKKKCKSVVRYTDYEFFKNLLHAKGFFAYDKMIADALEI